MNLSVRTRVGLAAALASMIVIVLAAAVIVRVVDQSQRDALDRRLSSGSVVLAQTLSSVQDREELRAVLAELDVGYVAQVVTATGAVRIRLGQGPSDFDTPELGFRTVDTVDGAWRVYTRRVVPGTQVVSPRVLVQTAAPLEPIEEETARVRRRVWFVGLGAVFLVFLVSLMLAGLALRSLSRLRRVAERVAASGDLTARVDVAGQPNEVASVATSINTMLERLQVLSVEREQALESSRAFAADASHELRTPLSSIAANLELLEDNPDLDDATRAQMLGELRREQARLAATLASLELLARGDLVGAPTEVVDLADLVSVAASAAGLRHEHLTVGHELPDGQVLARGWPDGLRVALDNLLDNAALHARPDGRGVAVMVTVAHEGDRWRITVDDDGRGIPARDRDRVLRRFERGQTTARGSGLGLPIVAQQARLLGSQLEVADSPTGGASFTFTVPMI